MSTFNDNTTTSAVDNQVTATIGDNTKTSSEDKVAAFIDNQTTASGDHKVTTTIDDKTTTSTVNTGAPSIGDETTASIHSKTISTGNKFTLNNGEIIPSPTVSNERATANNYMSTFTPPRKDGKTEAQAQAELADILTYYVDDTDGLIERNTVPPKTPVTPKAKKVAGKPKTPSSKTPSSSISFNSDGSIELPEEEYDPLTEGPDGSPTGRSKRRAAKKTPYTSDSSPRKSTRIAAGVKRPLPRGSYDAAIDNEQPAAKKSKTSSSSSVRTQNQPQQPPPPPPIYKSLKRKSSDEDEETELPTAKKSKRPTRASAQNKEQVPPPPPKKNLKRASSNDAEETEQPAAKKVKSTPVKKAKTISAKKASAATVQKHTGRFPPIGSMTRGAKKIEKRTVATDNEDIPFNDDVANDEATTDDAAEDGTIDAEGEDTESADDAEVTTKGNGKVKANAKGKGKAKKAAPKEFKGKPDGMGSSLDKPDDAQNTTHWKCANRNCTTGQTWHNREGAGGYGRKVISNFFGRNKKQTNFIHSEVWHNRCRKDYQRDTYSTENQGKRAELSYYNDNIAMQLVRINIWRPEAKFNVQLSKGASTRLNNYYKELTKNGGDEDKAAKAVTKTPGVKANGKLEKLSLEEGFPIEHIKHFDDTFTGENKSKDDLDVIVDWVQGLIDGDQTEFMPPIEFLINKQTDDEEGITDPNTNYERWAAYEDERDYDAPEEGETPAEDEEPDLTDDETVDDEATEPEAPTSPTPPAEKAT